MINSPEGLYFTFDFDNTGWKTFETVPGFYDVNQAVIAATSDVFGGQGVDILARQGGLQNRSSSELVHGLLKDKRTNTAQLLRKGTRFAEMNGMKLKKLVPEGKGVPLDFSGKLGPAILTELWTLQKLSYMFDQIGKTLPDGEVWPRPTPGFKEFWNQLQIFKNQGVNLKTGIVSSGHERFIERTFQAHQLAQPDTIASEDDIRGNKEIKNPLDYVKPAQFSLALALMRLLKINGFPTNGLAKDMFTKHGSETVYFGDDAHKDGDMAGSAGVLFGHLRGFNPKPLTNVDSFGFDHWTIPLRQLINQKNLVTEHKPVREIFQGIQE